MSCRMTFLACLPILLITGCATAADNLITNPGFEEPNEAGNFAAAWEPTYWSNPHGQITLADDARTGERCATIVGLPAEKITDAGRRNNHLIGQTINPPVVGMRKLILRAWCRCADNAVVFMAVMAKDAEGATLNYVNSRKHTGLAEWTELTLSFTTDQDTAQLIVYLRNEGEGPAWFDDVSLVASDDVLENDLLRVHVEPLLGGRLRTVFSKRQERDLTLWSGVRPGGFAADVVPGDDYPGLLRDSACQVEVLEPRTRVLLTHGPLPAPMDGLRIEKEVSLRAGAAALDVRLRVVNTSDGERTVRLRAQQCLPPAERVTTCPVEGGLRVIRPPSVLAKWGLDLPKLSDGWIASTEVNHPGGLLFRFDRDRTEKAYLYANQDLQTVEWYYQPVTIPAGGQWETVYTVAELVSNAPVVAASDSVAVGLTPLSVGKAGAHEVALSALREGVTAEVSATSPGQAAVRQELALSGAQASTVALPWDGANVAQIGLSLRAGEERLAATISAQTLDEAPLMDLPAPPERLTEFPLAAGFFPYGEYYRGIVGAEAGTHLDQVRRHLRAYRRAYMNTYMVGEHAMLSAVRDTGRNSICDLVREHRMKLIPRNDMMRRFVKGSTGRDEEQPPPETITREVALERIEQAYPLDVRRKFVETYGDLILAYDWSDEPGGEYIPLYMMIQSIYREVDPDHPILVILNLNRTEFLPYMPVYYGDEYPIRKDGVGGRNPWSVSKMVRFCATHTRAPVWVMLQAFGGREEYTWHLPNKAEQRLTLYETIANGGKGITFHGSCSPPCWRYNQYYFYPSIDSWLAETPSWEAMREEGRFLVAIGPALLESDVSDEAALEVTCEQIEGAGLMYQGPAVKAGILKRRDGGWFAVVVNQDVEKPRSAQVRVSPDFSGEGRVLYDLHSVQEVGPAASAAVSLELEPGDGQVFFLGTAEQAAEVLATVHRGHYDAELPLYEIDAGLARANGCDLAAAEASARDAATAYAGADFASASRLILQARAQVAEAIGANADLAASLLAVEKVHRLLTELGDTYRANFDVVVPPEDRTSAAGPGPFKNTRDPRMQGYVDRTAEAFCSRLKLEDRLYAGEAQAVAPEAAQLLEAVTALHAEAIPYATRAN